MKTKFILSLFVSLIICFNCSNILMADDSFKKLWKAKSENKIEKIFAIYLDKNKIKEILVLSKCKELGRCEKLELYSWERGTFVKRWQSSKVQEGVDIKYYDFNNLLSIKIYNSLNKTITSYKLSYEDGKCELKETKNAQIPFWQGENYVTSGSFKKKGNHDVLITSEGELELHLNIREAIFPYRLLWTSPFKIYKYEGVHVFGDFNGDKELELLVIPYRETIGYWLSSKGKEFEVKEIKSYRKSKDNITLPLFPINAMYPEKYLQAGRTTSKDFDEIYFIDENLYGGPLYKAVWQKDRFKIEEILSTKGITGYDNLNLADIDNDGLDEIIISEIRGDLVETEEEPFIKNHRDVIHILKWNGKKYKKIWTSQSLGAITQILVDDVTGDGKKEIVVGNGKGEIHIFGQK